MNQNLALKHGVVDSDSLTEGLVFSSMIDSEEVNNCRLYGFYSIDINTIEDVTKDPSLQKNKDYFSARIIQDVLKRCSIRENQFSIIFTDKVHNTLLFEIRTTNPKFRKMINRSVEQTIVDFNSSLATYFAD